MSNISLYIFYGLTSVTLATCLTIIILGICECISLRKKRQSARVIPTVEQQEEEEIIQERKQQIIYTYNPEFIEIITR